MSRQQSYMRVRGDSPGEKRVPYVVRDSLGAESSPDVPLLKDCNHHTPPKKPHVCRQCTCSSDEALGLTTDGTSMSNFVVSVCPASSNAQPVESNILTSRGSPQRRPSIDVREWHAAMHCVNKGEQSEGSWDGVGDGGLQCKHLHMTVSQIAVLTL